MMSYMHMTVLLFNLYRWDFIQDGDTLYEDMDRLVAYEKALETWAGWVRGQEC